MKWWTDEASRFWTTAGLSLIVLLVVGSFCHVSIVPARIYWSDYLIVAPLILCGFISVRAGKEVDIWTRLSYGFLQAIVLIVIYSNHWARNIRFDDPYYGVFIEWAFLTGIYAAVFAGVTQFLSTPIKERRRNSMLCETCGYCLRGLTEPRCPECGQPFDPARLGEAEQR